MTFKFMASVAIGIGLASVSHSLELRGDAAPFAADAVSPERAKFHIMALVALLGALGCFIYAGVSAFRDWRG